MRWMVKLSTPTSETIASVTVAFIPCTSDTTAMIDVTATMLPSTVRNDRSLFDQIALSAMPAASRNWFTLRLLPAWLLPCPDPSPARRPSALARTTKGPTMTLSPSLTPDSTSKYLSPANARLHRNELRVVVANHEDPFELLPRLPGLELRA